MSSLERSSQTPADHDVPATDLHANPMNEACESPGLSHVIVSPDGVEHEAHVGLMDADSDAPVSDETVYMAYSLTKPITAIAVLQLAQKGRVDLDAPLSHYMQDHPYGSRPTVRMLLSHTAGIPNPLPLHWFFVEGEPVDRDRAYHEVVRTAPGLRVLPGTNYRYSNIGYWLLEKMVEVVTNRDYAEVIRTGIFEPLGLTPEQATFEPPTPERMATGHSRKWSLSNSMFFMLTPWRYWASSANGWSRFHRIQTFGLGYGGLYATASAFSTLLCDLMSDEPVVLSDAWRDRMFARQRLTDGELTWSTLGWVTGALNGKPYVDKPGGGLGFQGNIRIYPEQRLGSVYLANSTSVSEAKINARADQLDAPFVL